jgi:hypothetical protein
LAVAWEDGSVVVWPLEPEFCGPPKEALSQTEVQQHWQALSESRDDAGAATAYRSVCALAQYPAQSLPLIKEKLKPVERIEKKRMQTLIADLDHDDFACREAASQELSRIIYQAEPLLHEALATSKSPEQIKRLKALLKGRPEWLIEDPDLLQSVRAIWVLQRIGSPEAKALLEKLAAGAPTARQTQEAQAALDYLKKSKAP